jgi:hypothetical protein
LCLTHALPGGCAHLSPFALWDFRRGDWLRAPTGQHGPEFGNLVIYPAFLRLESIHGGDDDFVRKFVRGHRTPKLHYGL